jgi:hypothetical protein
MNETKAFKGMKNDLTGYDNFKFSVGETYAIDPKKEIKPCESGFHACINLINCFGYYDNDVDNQFFEVTIFGDYIVMGDTICCRKIRIDKKIILPDELNGEYTSYYGNKYFYVNGQLHRDGDLSVIIRPNGTQSYYKNGLLHRDGDLPAVIYPDGTKEYFVNGKCYRGGYLPAIIDSGVMAVLSILQ